MEKQVLELLQVITFKIDTLSSDMSVVKSDIANMKIDITDMKADIRNMKADIRNMKTDIRKTNSRIDVLELKHDNTHAKLERLILDVKIGFHNVDIRLKKLDDENETIIQRLREKEILPI